MFALIWLPCIVRMTKIDEKLAKKFKTNARGKLVIYKSLRGARLNLKFKEN